MTAASVATAGALKASDNLGVPRSALLDVLSGGRSACRTPCKKAHLTTTHDYIPGFPVALALKDIRLIEEAEARTSPLVPELDRRLASAAKAGHAHDDLAGVAAVD
jgi:3-hydroxyisobutyrate dehydrogenase